MVSAARLFGGRPDAREPAGTAREPARPSIWPACLLVLAGALVMLGWLLQVRTLTQLAPGMTSMVFNTALCFAVFGLALPSLDARSRLRRDAAQLALAGVLVLVVLNAIQLASGLDLGINHARLHAWAADDNPVPGQMSGATTVSFLFAATAALMLRYRGTPMFSMLGRALSLMVLLAGLLALVGYALRLEALYGWYAFHHMALHTAVGMTLLGTVLGRAWREPGPAFPDERQIAAIGTAALVVVAAVAGVAGAAAFRAEGERGLEKSLALTREARADVFVTTIRLHSQQARQAALRPTVVRQLQLLARTPADAAAQAGARAVLDLLKEHGFSSIELHSAAGGVLLGDAGATPAGAREMPLSGTGTGTGPGGASLVWGDRFVLRNRVEIRADDALLGVVVTEQPLPLLNELLAVERRAGSGDETRLCGRLSGAAEPVCLSTDPAQPADATRPLAGPARSIIEAALAGASGVASEKRADGHPQLTLYGPAGSTGLALAVDFDAEPFNAPIRRSLAQAFLLVALVTIMAVLLLRARVGPLARRLAVAEGRYQTVVRSLREGLVLQDAEQRVLASNPAASAILGIGEDRLAGSTASDAGLRLFHADGRECGDAEYPAARTLATGIGENDVVVSVEKPDGSRRWLSLNTVPAENLAGTGERGVVVSFEDITDRRRAEALNRQLEQRFRLLVDSIADYGVLMLGHDGTIVSWNAGAERISGYRADEIVGRNFARFYLPEDQLAGRPRRELGIAAESGRFHDENWRVRRDGTRFWASVVINAMRDDDGQLIGYAQVTRDLTERRLAEQSIAEANRLRDAILDCTPYGIIAVDPEGLITSVNPAFEQMVWYEAAEVIGTRKYEAIVAPEEFSARAAELSAEAGRPVEGLEVFTYNTRQRRADEREWTFVRKGGSRIPVSLAVSTLRDSEGRITGYLGVAHDITERRRRDEYTQHIAHHDFLTGLPNRTLLHDRLGRAIEQARRGGREVAVMMLDLDHFKRVNDSLGHQVGDQLLATVADRIVGCVRAGDTVARMGGDEFVIVLGDIDRVDGIAGIERVAADIVDQVAAPMRLGEHELMVTPSLGISRYPVDAEDVDVLLRHADTAMYLAKSGGRHGYRLFDADMERAAKERLSLENALRRALRNEEFELRYQPQVCLLSGAVIGMEALLRWTDPERGAVSPADFIPLAEDSGQILQLGEWVLRRACHEARDLQRRTGLPLRLAVNLSARQFRHADIVATIASALSDSGLLAQHLEVEITEGVLMANTAETIERLRQIRAMGVSIAVDDFGVGFSSLSYISRFPIDTLKIDRAFVTHLPDNPSDCAVAQAIIALARSLDIRVVAEGVETARQLSFLRAKTCDVGQGFHFGAAVPASMLSVQGFHFGPAVTPDSFVEQLPALQAAGLRSAALAR